MRVMMPSAGTRFTWTLRIDRKVRHAPARHGAEAEFRRRHGGRHRDHAAIGGRDHRAGPAGRHALGIAEEEQAEQGEQQAEPGQPWRERQAEHHRDQAAQDEWPPGGMGRGEHVADVFDEGHSRRGLWKLHLGGARLAASQGASAMPFDAPFKLGPFTVDSEGRLVALRAGDGAGLPVPLARPRRAGAAGSGGRRRPDD